MIYLIRSAAFKNKDDKKCKDLEVLLKIGYTGENSKKSRFNVYLTENPTAQILYIIPGGTIQDERNLHQYFMKYKIDCGREWFSEVPEILDFFETHTTKESLKELNSLHKELHKKIEDVYFSRILLNIINTDKSKYLDTKKYLYNEIDNILNSFVVDDIDEYFRTTYPDIDFNVEEVSVSEDNIYYEFIESFREEFRQDENFVRRMRMYYRLVTEFSDIYIQNIKIFNSIIPIHYQNYMNLLGPERIKAYGYREVDINNESKSVLNLDKVRSEIVLKFVPGNKYSAKKNQARC